MTPAERQFLLDAGEDTDVQFLWRKKTSALLDPIFYAPANWFTAFR